MNKKKYKSYFMDWKFDKLSPMTLPIIGLKLGFLVPIKHCWGCFPPTPPFVKFDPDILEGWNLEGWKRILCSTK